MFHRFTGLPLARLSSSIAFQKAAKLLVFCLLALWSSLAALNAAPLLQTGQTVAFLGDSITAQGANAPGGYVRLVESGAASNGVTIKVLAAGVSGHKSNQMLERLERDILSKKPDWMTLSCGVNDVWHGDKGVSLEEYKQNITQILDRCSAAGVKVCILTATQIGLPLDNPNNQKLVPYNAFLREIAQARQLPLADLNAAMAAEQNANAASGLTRTLTTDGVHMNHHGNVMMAAGVLRAFGFDDTQIASAKKKWRTTPESVPVTATLRMTLADMENLEAAAQARKQSVEALIAEQFRNALKALLSEPHPAPAKP